MNRSSDFELTAKAVEDAFNASPTEGQRAVLGAKTEFEDAQPFMRPTIPGWDELAPDVREIIQTGMLTKGCYLERFEELVAEYLGVRHAIAVSSCTSGLMLLYQALGLAGDVIVPSFTFMATVHAMAWLRIKPLFVDADPLTWNVDPKQVEESITPRTTAIVAVHVFGNPAPVEVLEEIARRHRLPLIFDAAHGFGALHYGRPLGSRGLAEVFSTSPTKLLVTGEGGVVTTNDDRIAKHIRIGREYGNSGDYDSRYPGMNARMQEFSAILGIHSLGMLEMNARRRNVIAQWYKEHLADIPGLAFQDIQPFDRSSYKDLTIRIDAKRFGVNRDNLQEYLALEGISTRAYYVPPMHRHRTYQSLVRKQRPFLPITESLAEEVLSLPIYSHMPEENVIRVCEVIRRVHKNTLMPRRA